MSSWSIRAAGRAVGGQGCRGEAVGVGGGEEGLPGAGDVVEGEAVVGAAQRVVAPAAPEPLPAGQVPDADPRPRGDDRGGVGGAGIAEQAVEHRVRVQAHGVSAAGTWAGPPRRFRWGSRAGDSG